MNTRNTIAGSHPDIVILILDDCLHEVVAQSVFTIEDTGGGEAVWSGVCPLSVKSSSPSAVPAHVHPRESVHKAVYDWFLYDWFPLPRFSALAVSVEIDEADTGTRIRAPSFCRSSTDRFLE